MIELSHLNNFLNKNKSKLFDFFHYLTINKKKFKINNKKKLQ